MLFSATPVATQMPTISVIRNVFCIDFDSCSGRFGGLKDEKPSMTVFSVADFLKIPKLVIASEAKQSTAVDKFSRGWIAASLRSSQ